MSRYDSCPECGSPADAQSGGRLCVCDGPPPPRQAYVTDEASRGLLIELLRECQFALTGPADLRQRIEDAIGRKR